ncbi:hypothetical protein LTR84_009292 [Exophiala bonariae]|uniref:Atg28p n=1 Tax=Exophiala bonariae TaxID=1690606 RepID=A0AAV9MXU9_9EURO|nr:hypothetical protein LTR84_009292 [Exophiala bonariae]
MNKSFIDRIFPQTPGSRLPQYEYDLPPSSTRSSASLPPRIALQDSIASSPRSRQAPSISPRPRHSNLVSSIVRHDDPFLPVERASKSLERTLQGLLDAQSEGLSAGVSADEVDNVSSVGSPTPTPSVVTPTTRRDSGLKTIPIRQPKAKKISLRRARMGLGKAMKEFADLKTHELKLIEREVVVRDEALKQVSDLSNQRTVLDDKIYQIQHQDTSVGLQSEVQKVEQEIREVENTLFELKARHRQLKARLREEDSTKGSRLSSYSESLRLNDTQTRTFLRHPPVPQGLRPDFSSGMYALKPERRTLQMAQEQWTTEKDVLNLRKSDVESEKLALEEGSSLWRDVVGRITAFEQELRAQTRDLSQSQLQSYAGDPALAKLGLDASMQVILSKLSALMEDLERDLNVAEQRGWNLLVCAIGAERAALELARGLLVETSDVANGGGGGGHDFDDAPGNPDLGHELNGHSGFGGEDSFTTHESHDTPHEDLLHEQPPPSSSMQSMPMSIGMSTVPRSKSPGETSNQSLEDTLREFGAGTGTEVRAEGKGKEREREKAITSAPVVREPMSESEDDDPGPDFFLSH